MIDNYMIYSYTWPSTKRTLDLVILTRLVQKTRSFKEMTRRLSTVYRGFREHPPILEVRGGKVCDCAVRHGIVTDDNEQERTMSNEKIYTGSCFCGEVQFEVSGQPTAMGYCHCESCRHWSAGPVNAFTLWKPEALRVTSG